MAKPCLKLYPSSPLCATTVERVTRASVSGPRIYLPFTRRARGPHLWPVGPVPDVYRRARSQVWSVPAESVFISWTLYAFTFVFICLYTVTAMCLLNSFLRMLYVHNERDGGSWFEYFWTAYEAALLTIVLFTLFAIADRWKLMERGAKQYNKHTELSIVPIVLDMCRVHDHLNALASVTVALTLFRMYRAIKYADRLSRIERMVRESGLTMVVVMAYAVIVTVGTGSYTGLHELKHEFFNSFLFSRNAFSRGLSVSAGVECIVYVIVYVSVVVVFVKHYVLSEMYLRPTVVRRPEKRSPGLVSTHKY